jgi:8-oxo-dGTP diphosphatase
MAPLRGPLVGAAAIVLRDGRVLLGERQGAHGAGAWAFPGGKVDAGEDAADTVARELAEETGLTATAVRPLAWTNDLFVADGLHYVTLHHLVDVAPGEPRVLEPDKCREWGWFAWDALPAPLFVPVANLAAAGWRP